MSDTRIVIAFAEPPAHFRFTRAKSGKCWVRTVKTREFALELAQKLVDIDIHGVIKKTTALDKAPSEQPERGA